MSFVHMPSSDLCAPLAQSSANDPCQVFLFLGPQVGRYGGMENHGHALLRWLRHAKAEYTLGACFVKDELGRTVQLNEHGSAIDCCDSAKKLACLVNLLARGRRVVMFFNTGHWIEELAELRKSVLGALFVARTGGNEILQASLTDMSIKHHDRQTIWVNTINRCIDVFITNSAFTERRLSGLGIDAKLCARVRGGVDTQAAAHHLGARRSRTAPAIRRVVWAGRFVAFKGLHVLLDAMHMLTRDDVELVLIGDGPLLPDVQDHAVRLGMASRVRFTGALAPHECLQALATCDLYVALSLAQERMVSGGRYVHTETMGRSVMEALCCGLRVVASDVGGLAELVGPSVGELVPAGDAGAAAGAIARQLALPPMTQTQRLALAADFDWTTVFGRYAALWSSGHA